MPGAHLLAPLDQQLVWNRYARAAIRGLDDPLAREIDQRMQERLDYVQIDPRFVLDLGAGAGLSAEGLSLRYPSAQMLQLDAVETLLPKPQQPKIWTRWLKTLLGTHPPRNQAPHPICADARQLPLPSSSLGLIWSNMLLPWVDNISLVISEAHRVLEPNGLLMFSTLGPSTLSSLDDLFGDGKPHRHDFPDMHDLGDLLGHTGFCDPVVDMEIIQVEYGSLANLVNDLRSAAAVNSHSQKQRGLTGKKVWRNLAHGWEHTASSSSSLKTVRISFEIVYGHAWKDTPKALPDGRSIIHFDPKSRGIPA